ncbi:threonine/serine dehydratase [Pseudomonas shirazica]|uniref:Threonine/serine dehydratase n=1 Tax=Pseudomonas shirazica TaxID=1940636 RepID=A0ABY9SYC1_9PSED|nr:threonine/serine dehydratase [Pseudomonas shirazica]WMY87485.1 threonine/serine dehydratase [Pseudomonas shirazica]
MSSIEKGERPVPPTLKDIEEAAVRIKDYAARTPLLESPELNKLVGGRVLFKPEVLQRTASFKFRGACNRLLQLSAKQQRAGVVAFSSGNHALATSAVGRILNIPATIIMPSDAPQAKIKGARANGATVILYNRQKDDREAIGAEIANRTGATMVPPYNDPFIIAGQATVGLEIMEDLEHLGIMADSVLAACSGGGLIAGVATAVRAKSESTQVFAVEPAGFDELARSLASGKRESNAPGAKSICDALQVVTPGDLTFDINQRLLAGSLVVTDDEVRKAMRVAYDKLKLILEPGGAVGLAAVLEGRVETRGRTTVVVLSGGNVDPELYAEIITAH